MAEIRVEEKRGGAGRWLLPLLLLLALAAALYWFFVMRDGTAVNDAPSDTAIVQPSDTAATGTTGATATSPSTP